MRVLSKARELFRNTEHKWQSRKNHIIFPVQHVIHKKAVKTVCMPTKVDSISE